MTFQPRGRESTSRSGWSQTASAADDMADASDPKMNEWTECRLTIGRFDGILADTRKYGFALVTILLTANALVTPANPVADKLAAASVIILLLLVLFLLDRYYWILLRAAVVRAAVLEESMGNGIEITVKLGQFAHRTKANGFAVVVYGLFVTVSALIAAAAVWLTSPVLAIVTVLATAIPLFLLYLIYRWVDSELRDTASDKLERFRQAGSAQHQTS
jgi:hypothetical protein